MGNLAKQVSVIDINPNKKDTFLPGIANQIFSPDSLGLLSPQIVLVMNPVYQDEVFALTRKLGSDAKIVSVHMGSKALSL